LKVDAVAVTSGGCSARSSAQRELVTSGLYTTLADSTRVRRTLEEERRRPLFRCVSTGGEALSL
jgi:hypothetical protein